MRTTTISSRLLLSLAIGCAAHPFSADGPAPAPSTSPSGVSGSPPAAPAPAVSFATSGPPRSSAAVIIPPETAAPVSAPTPGAISVTRSPTRKSDGEGGDEPQSTRSAHRDGIAEFDREGEHFQVVASPTERIKVVMPVINTELERDGHPTSQPAPLPTKLREPLKYFEDAEQGSDSMVIRAVQHSFYNQTFSGVFKDPIATDRPGKQFLERGDHPVKKHKTTQDSPINTNEFYANMFLGNRNLTAWSLPYMLRWNEGLGAVSKTFGMTVSRMTLDMRWYGPDKNADPVQYYINPSDREQIVFGADELQPGKSGFALKDTKPNSARAEVYADEANPDKGKAIFPMCSGMGLVSALINGLTPLFHTGEGGFREVQSKVVRDGLVRHVVTMSMSNWLIYTIETEPGGFNKSTGNNRQFKLMRETEIKMEQPFHGVVQFARLPEKNGTWDIRDVEEYENSAGVFCTGYKYDGTLSPGKAELIFEFQKGGPFLDAPLFMFALPHHRDAISNLVPSQITERAPTKGLMTGYAGDKWVMAETDVPTEISWAPWSRSGRLPEYTPEAISAIQTAMRAELDATDWEAIANPPSYYYAGKALSKLAMMCTSADMVLKKSNPDIVKECLELLNKHFQRFVENKSRHPLVYDTVWKGLVSSASYETGDLGLDFGNTAYNDHHFHYGYHVHAGAVLARLYTGWKDNADNVKYVYDLVRDYANPSCDDPHFPALRAWDPFHGHGWAKGLFESGDGKDQESASEDYFSVFAQKLWGEVMNDENLFARSTITLSVMRRANSRYFQILPDNNVHDPKFIKNLVHGILFEAKVDCTTYFGMNREFIHMIQVIPISPITPFMRPEGFVRLEWETFFDKNRWQNAQGGWVSLLKGNEALIDETEAWRFFSAPNFDMTKLDGGASLAWLRTWVAGIGGLGGQGHTEKHTNVTALGAKPGIEVANATADQEVELENPPPT